MDNDTIQHILFRAILRHCGDTPFPLGLTDFPEQAEWSRIMSECRKELCRKVKDRMETAGIQIGRISEEQIQKHIDNVVQEGLEILQRPTSDVFEDGGQEFHEWLKK